MSIQSYAVYFWVTLCWIELTNERWCDPTRGWQAQVCTSLMCESADQFACFVMSRSLVSEEPTLYFIFRGARHLGRFGGPFFPSFSFRYSVRFLSSKSFFACGWSTMYILHSLFCYDHQLMSHFPCSGSLYVVCPPESQNLPNLCSGATSLSHLPRGSSWLA